VTLPEHLIENSSYWLAGLKHRDQRPLQPRLRNAETDEADRAVSAGAIACIVGGMQRNLGAKFIDFLSETVQTPVAAAVNLRGGKGAFFGQ